MKTALVNEKIIEVVNKNSPEFENEVDPIEFMELLDRLLHQINLNPNEKTVQVVHNELQSFEVITTRLNGNLRWITEPMTFERSKTERSTIHRIMHLVKTGTQWTSKYVQRSHIRGKNSIPIPIALSVNSSFYDARGNDSLSKLKCSVIALKQTILERLRSDMGNLGIFEKPDGVVNMNLMNAWFEEMKAQDGIQWTKKYPLTIMSMDEIAESIVFTLNTND